MLFLSRHKKMNEKAPFYYVLSSIEGFGKVTTRKLLEKVGSVKRLFTEAESLNELSPAIRRKLLEARENPPLWEEANRVLSLAEEEGISIITIEDPNYPMLLKECADAPLILYLKGNIEQLQQPHMLSVVGTRNASSYGRFAVTKLLEGLAQKVPDLVVVSGLALGIDITAHRSALELGLGTIAVMAYGHHFVYPYEHRKDAEQIVQKGIMLSEYPPDTQIERHRFVARNRIVAGLSLGTVVIESAQKGGALLTASMATDYNREVFALPGRITDKYSAGCNKMISSSQALAFTSEKEIIEALGWQNTPSTLQQTTLASSQPLPEDPILQLIAKEESMLFDELLLKSDLRASDLSSKLFDLELEGYIESLPGGRYTLAFR